MLNKEPKWDVSFMHLLLNLCEMKPVSIVFYLTHILDIFIERKPHCLLFYLHAVDCVDTHFFFFLGANAPLGPASSEALSVCMYVTF